MEDFNKEIKNILVSYTINKNKFVDNVVLTSNKCLLLSISQFGVTDEFAEGARPDESLDSCLLQTERQERIEGFRNEAKAWQETVSPIKLDSVNLTKLMKTIENYSENHPSKLIVLSNVIVACVVLNDEMKALAYVKVLDKLISNRASFIEQIMEPESLDFAKEEIILSIKSFNHAIIMLRKLKLDSILNNTVFEMSNRNSPNFVRLK